MVEPNIPCLIICTGGQYLLLFDFFFIRWEKSVICSSSCLDTGNSFLFASSPWRESMTKRWIPLNDLSRVPSPRVYLISLGRLDPSYSSHNPRRRSGPLKSHPTTSPLLNVFRDVWSLIHKVRDFKRERVYARACVCVYVWISISRLSYFLVFYIGFSFVLLFSSLCFRLPCFSFVCSFTIVFGLGITVKGINIYPNLEVTLPSLLVGQTFSFWVYNRCTLIYHPMSNRFSFSYSLCTVNLSFVPLQPYLYTYSCIIQFYFRS